MRLSQMDLNLFVVFDAIYAKRNLTRAAETLCVTQPAVSNALARMRKVFDDPLFVSTPQGMVPTPVADHLMSRVGEALQLLGTGLHERDSFDPAVSTTVFRLSMTDLAEALLLPPLGETLQRQAPGMRVESYFTRRGDLPRELAAGALDLAIDAPLIDDPQLNQIALLTDRYACMLRRDHPFGGDRLSLDD